MPKRYDNIEMSNVQKGDNGFLTYDFLAAQTGVFPYWDWMTGDIVYELKHPEDLLKDEVVKQLNNIPICEDHPWDLVTTDNAKEYIKGLTNNSAHVEDNKLAGQGTVFDAALIGKILNEDKKECSLGFECKVIDESGTFEGVHYDRRQTDFKINHLAMVAKGRCGPECSAKLDSKEDGAVQIRLDQVDEYKKRKDDKTMIKIKLDGVDFEVDEKVKARIDALEESNTTLTKQVGQLEGKLDGKEDEINTLKADNEHLKKTQLNDEALDNAVKARLALVEETKAILGDEYDYTGKTEKQIKIDCIIAANKEFKADGKSDDYINARYDTIKEFMASETSSVGDNNLKFRKTDSQLEAKKAARLNIRK